jgi:23S rRNA G2069 N7-methylase RlmK/C1962 C5-methylase RlmI
VALLQPGGLLWAAANTESLAADRFKSLIRKVLERAGRPTRTLAVAGLPPDYPTLDADPEARYLKVHVLEVL